LSVSQLAYEFSHDSMHILFNQLTPGVFN